ncbi:MAG: hypothetical protein OEO77_03645 [Acidimicrobiia bacterium]|nr:hypothetical protein [Acidimicrobiia bacterium]
MAPVLQNRMALFAMMAVFLIPVFTSSLRGLTHVLTCQEEVAQPFTVVFEDGEALVLSSVVVTSDDPDPALCGGLIVDVQARAVNTTTAALTLIVTNGSDVPWRGTVNVALGDAGILGARLVPVAIGKVGPGDTETETLEFRLGDGYHEFSGSLLIGP